MVVVAPTKCHLCKRTITGPKIVVKERWTCTECVYYEQMRLPNPNAPERRNG